MTRATVIWIVVFLLALAVAACGEEGDGGTSTNCADGYSKCLDADAPDYDCEGGSGDGPRYVSGPIEVTGSDPFGLDRDRNGVGCE